MEIQLVFWRGRTSETDCTAYRFLIGIVLVGIMTCFTNPWFGKMYFMFFFHVVGKFRLLLWDYWHSDTRPSADTALTKFRSHKYVWNPGVGSVWRCHQTSVRNLIVEMGFPILVGWHLYIESGSSTLRMNWNNNRLRSGTIISRVFHKWKHLKFKIIKSPQYTGGDFMFLYRFVRRRRRPQILVHAITFEQLFGFLSFLAWLLALTYRLTD